MTGRLNPYRAGLVESYETSIQQRRNRPTDDFRVAERQRFHDHLVEAGARSLLEIGCGAGHDSVFFRNHGFQVQAIDTTPGLVDVARSQGVDAELFDLYDLRTRTQVYDAVFTVNCLLHVPAADIDAVLTSIADRLKPSGSMYLGLWGDLDSEGILETDSYEPKRFFSFRSAETLVELLRDRFQLDYLRRIPTESGHVFNSLIVTRRP